MRAIAKTGLGHIALASAGAALCLAVLGCGSDDFANEPRPPAPRQLTGVIQDDKVTISPATEGAGAIVITVSNQTDRAYTLTLEGEAVEERVGPIQPQDTATIQKTLATGSYEVSAGSDEIVTDDIRPATLTIGPNRDNSSGELLLP